MTCRSPRSMALARVLFSDELSIQRSSAFLVVSHFLPTFLTLRTSEVLVRVTRVLRFFGSWQA
jgi:hypothetical protein